MTPNVPTITSLCTQTSSRPDSILDNEEEFAPLLMAIEETIVDTYDADKSLTDTKVQRSIYNLIKHIDEPFDEFNKNFEQLLYVNLILALQEEPFTIQEVTKCLRYIVWCVDNRSWLEDTQAYVKWLAYSSGAMSDEQARQYEKKMRKFYKSKGIPDHQIAVMLDGQYDDLAESSISIVADESAFFSLDDAQKVDYIRGDPLRYSSLLLEYLNHLISIEDFVAAETLCNQVIAARPDMFLVIHALADVYKAQGDADKAIEQYNRVLDHLKEVSDDTGQKDQLIAMIKADIDELSK